jgi:hypothetical protein
MNTMRTSVAGHALKLNGRQHTTAFVPLFPDLNLSTLTR